MSEDDALTTLSLLETRLSRIEFLLSGSADIGSVSTTIKPPDSHGTVSDRLAKLEEDLRRLTSKSGLIQDTLRLLTRYPDLFQPSTDDSRSKSIDISTIASVVLAHASAFPETASRLSSLQTLPIPEAGVSAQLVDLQPRIDKAAQIQQQQQADVAALRARSANLVERWVNIGVVGMGELWAEWETRIQGCGRTVAAIEARVAREAT